MTPRQVEERPRREEMPGERGVWLEDGGFDWHTRLLIISDEHGRWIGASPDLDVSMVDLTEHRVV